MEVEEGSEDGWETASDVSEEGAVEEGEEAEETNARTFSNGTEQVCGCASCLQGFGVSSMDFRPH